MFYSRCFLSFLEGISDEIDAPVTLNSAKTSLSPEHEMVFLDVDDTSDFPDDLNEDNSVFDEDHASILDEIMTQSTWQSRCLYK